MPKNLPPDDEQIALAAIVNEKLRPLASVNFYRVQHEDGSITPAMIASAGQRRALSHFKESRTTHDAAEIVTAVEEWIGRSRANTVAERYTTDFEAAQSPDWRSMS